MRQTQTRSAYAWKALSAPPAVDCSEEMIRPRRWSCTHPPSYTSTFASPSSTNPPVTNDEAGLAVSLHELRQRAARWWWLDPRRTESLFGRGAVVAALGAAVPSSLASCGPAPPASPAPAPARDARDRRYPWISSELPRAPPHAACQREVAQGARAPYLIAGRIREVIAAVRPRVHPWIADRSADWEGQWHEASKQARRYAEMARARRPGQRRSHRRRRAALRSLGLGRDARGW